jgi:Zn-dependent protease
MPTTKGSLKLFTFAGIGVYVHWMWFVFAVLTFQYRTHAYSSLVWNALEYLSIFLIVLLHEFGHQLACRQVGGKTHDIVLWFLGGVAYVSPPQRPGAQLWSIAAGPLVNVLLIPVFSVLVSVTSHLDWYNSHPDAYELFHSIWWINVGLLIFNLLPIYPLDGGQILRSLLWFVFGRANSLLIASVLGFVGVAGLIALAIREHSQMMGLIIIFVVFNCWGGLKQARALARLAKLPRREGFACPACKSVPPVGTVWHCGKCRQAFDIFLTGGTCPHCGTQFNLVPCLDCGTVSPISEWSHPSINLQP